MPTLPFAAGVEIAVESDRALYLPGEVIEARVTIRGRAETRVEEGWLGLVVTHRYTYRERQVSSRGQRRTVRVCGSEREVAASARFMGERTIWPGDWIEERASLTVPVGAPASGVGAIVAVGWTVRAALDVRRANDPEAEVPVGVLAPRETHADRAERGPWRNDIAEETMAAGFDLATRHVRPGEAVEGRLRLTAAAAAMDARGLRVELVRREEVSREEGLIEERVVSQAGIALDAPLAAGVEQGFDFAVPVPVDACPGLETGRSAVRWLLRAVVDLPRRRDPVAVVELNVFNGGEG